MRVLITGGTSLLGREVALTLQERGDTVRLFQRRSATGTFDEHLGDINDPAAVDGAVTGMDAVVHVAGRVGIVGSWGEFHQTNVTGTANLLAAAQAEGIDRFVHISSPSVAHSGDSLVGAGAGPADPANARGHYAKSKAEGELLALAANSSNFPVLVLRPHLIWGPGDTQLVGRIIDRARAGRLATVGTGAALIDTTYISNAAAAVVAGLDATPDIAGRVFVVSNGQPRPVAEMIARIVRAAGLEPPTIRVPFRLARTGGLAVERIWDRIEREDDPPMTSFLAEQLATAHWFDQRETQAALQWRPAVSIDEGFARLREWYSQQ
ncbi:MAG: NAD-dependent epimerase/dehydratase family protein [Acidimicrobiia bacterium]|nr:NAD-dependent epimerase/dehydratase family protein [Acidimicrobiia bacterium]